MFWQPCAFACYKKGVSYRLPTARNDSPPVPTRLSPSALRKDVSLGRLLAEMYALSVQQRCMQHSMPIVSWQTCTRLDVRSAFFPPAPLRLLSFLVSTHGVSRYHVISINSGPRFRIRSIRSYRFCRPCTRRQRASLPKRGRPAQEAHLRCPRRKELEAPE